MNLGIWVLFWFLIMWVFLAFSFQLPSIFEVVLKIEVWSLRFFLKHWYWSHFSSLFKVFLTFFLLTHDFMISAWQLFWKGFFGKVILGKGICCSCLREPVMSQDLLCSSHFCLCYSVCLIPSLATGLKQDSVFLCLESKVLLCEVGSNRLLQDLGNVTISTVNLEV